MCAVTIGDGRGRWGERGDGGGGDSLEAMPDKSTENARQSVVQEGEHIYYSLMGDGCGVRPI